VSVKVVVARCYAVLGYLLGGRADLARESCSWVQCGVACRSRVTGVAPLVTGSLVARGQWLGGSDDGRIVPSVAPRRNDATTSPTDLRRAAAQRLPVTNPRGRDNGGQRQVQGLAVADRTIGGEDLHAVVEDDQLCSVGRLELVGDVPGAAYRF